MSVSVNSSLFVACLDTITNFESTKINENIDFTYFNNDLDKLKYIANDLLLMYVNRRGILKKKDEDYCIIFTEHVFAKEYKKIESKFYDFLLILVSKFVKTALLNFDLRYERQRNGICIFFEHK